MVVRQTGVPVRLAWRLNPPSFVLSRGHVQDACFLTLHAIVVIR